MTTIANCGASGDPRDPYCDSRMISWNRYGYRMIGSADRAALARARYMGASNVFNAGPMRTGGHYISLGEGEQWVPDPPTPPPPPPVRIIDLPFLHPKPPAVHIINLPFLGPKPPAAPPPPPPPLVQHVASDTFTVPTPAPCPTCDPCTKSPSPLLIGGVSAVGAGLLMYFVGLSTRETKAKKRRR